VLAAGDAGTRCRAERRAAAAVELHRLEELAAGVGVAGRVDGVARPAVRPVRVEQAYVEPVVKGRDLAGGVVGRELGEAPGQLADRATLRRRGVESEQERGGVPGMQQLQLAILVDARDVAVGEEPAERGDDRVVMRAAVLAEEVR